MAYTATVLDEYRQTASNLDLHELRLSTYGAFDAFVNDTPNLLPQWKDLVDGRVSAARTASLVVQQKATLVTSATRSCSAKTAQGTSAFVTPSWTTIETGFFMNPAEHVGNYVSYQNAFNVQMLNVERAFLSAVDTAAVAALEANKSTVHATDGNPFTVAGNDIQVPAADAPLYLNELGSIMLANDYLGDMLTIVASPRFRALVNQYGSQGTGNAVNYAFQFPGYKFGYTPRVIPGAGDRDIVYASALGSLAYLSWVDIDSRLGSKSTSGVVWSEELLPRLGHNVGLLYASSCSDTHTRLTGLDASMVESFMYSFDYSFVTSYISAGASPIFKADLSLT
jgi:hypothetical protein